MDVVPPWYVVVPPVAVVLVVRVVEVLVFLPPVAKRLLPVLPPTSGLVVLERCCSPLPHGFFAPHLPLTTFPHPHTRFGFHSPGVANWNCQGIAPLCQVLFGGTPLQHTPDKRGSLRIARPHSVGRSNPLASTDVR